jgi:two-component system nitrogen regulation sensor histidine kinase GlnL
MADLLHHAITMAETKASRGDVTVAIQLAPELPMIEGDHHQLCQVFTNLIANAYEALQGKGRITIHAVASSVGAEGELAGTQPATEMVLVDVADNGPGIPAELTDKIFNPFFTTKVQGSGLGLAIVRKILDAHDGRIDVNSSAETGTRFRVTLPISSASTCFKPARDTK